MLTVWVGGQPSGAEVFPLHVKAKFIGIVSLAISIIFMWAGEGVQVVAHVPMSC